MTTIMIALMVAYLIAFLSVRYYIRRQERRLNLKWVFKSRFNRQRNPVQPHQVQPRQVVVRRVRQPIACASYAPGFLRPDDDLELLKQIAQFGRAS
ncbi:MAG: hypothetical protein ABSD89_11385 [Halobacteriota archaeon]|jgi:hypothetical protein